jgi:hypothetical protein
MRPINVINFQSRNNATINFYQSANIVSNRQQEQKSRAIFFLYFFCRHRWQQHFFNIINYFITIVNTKDTHENKHNTYRVFQKIDESFRSKGAE